MLTGLDTQGICRVSLDPKVGQYEGGEYASFSVATNKRIGQGDNARDEASFFDCICFGNVSKAASKLKKGSAIYIKGEITLRKWTDKEGNPRQKHQITVYHINFLDPPPAKAEGSTGSEEIPFC
jgi:single stranded DNA-binding protein